MSNHENSLGSKETFINNRYGFTLTEVLLAISIVGVIAALVLPMIISNYQNKALNLGYNRITRTIEGAVNNLVVNENKDSFQSTIMYMDSTPSDVAEYEEKSGKFIKKYLKVNKYCGTTNKQDCFANKYYTYDMSSHKKVLANPSFDGACAILKDGASVCIVPQIGASGVKGIIDINGKKGPNVYCGANATGNTEGCDLKEFFFESQNLAVAASASLHRNGDDANIKNPPEEPPFTPSSSDPDCSQSGYSAACCANISVIPPSLCCAHYENVLGHPCYVEPPPPTACEIDPNSEECCATKTFPTNSSTLDPCCAFPSIKNKNELACTDSVKVNLSCEIISGFGSHTPSKTIKCTFTQTPNIALEEPLTMLIDYCSNTQYNGACDSTNTLTAYGTKDFPAIFGITGSNNNSYGSGMSPTYSYKPITIKFTNDQRAYGPSSSGMIHNPYSEQFVRLQMFNWAISDSWPSYSNSFTYKFK